MDCDWQSIPAEVLQLPLTRLHLRYADFADGGCYSRVWGRGNRAILNSI